VLSAYRAMRSHILVTVLIALACHLYVESTDSYDDSTTDSCFCQVCVNDVTVEFPMVLIVIAAM